VWPAIPERHSKPLAVTDHYIGTPLPGRGEQRKAQQISGHSHQRFRGMSAITKIPVIDHGAVSSGILNQHPENFITQGRCMIADDDAQPACIGSRSDNIDCLRMAPVRHEENVPSFLPAQSVTHRHRFSSSRRLVEKRCIGDLHPREVDNHCLKIQQRLETALRYLCLVRRVGRIPCRVFNDVSLNDRWGYAVRVTHSDE